MKGKKMLKKFVALCLVTSLLFGFVPSDLQIVKPIKTYAASGVELKINELRSMYPDGSYFSVNGSACSHGQKYTCSNCQLSSIMNAKYGGFPNGMTDANTCCGYARFAFWYIFGIPFNKYTHAGMTSVNIEQALPGDYIVVNGGTHYGIYLYSSGDSIYLYEANMGTPNLVKYGSYAYKKSSATEVWRANNYDSINSVKPVTTVTLGLEKTGFLCAEHVTFYGNADGGGSGHVDIYKEGTYLKSLTLSPNSYVTDYFDTPGSYHAVYYVSDGTNTVASEAQNFTVHNTDVCGPQNMNVGLEKNSFAINEAVTVYMFCDYVTSYDLKIYKDGTEVVSENVKAYHGCIPGNTYKIYKFSEPGNYIIKAQGKNMYNVSEQKECSFVVQGNGDSSTVDKPVTKVTLELNDTVFLCTGPIIFTGNTDGGNTGYLDIYKEGTYYKRLNLFPNSKVTEYFDYAGSYHAVYYVSDGTNTVASDAQNFTVHNTNVCVPQNMEVGLEKNKFDIDEAVTVYMFSDYVTSYDLKIFKDDIEIVSENIKAFHGCVPGYTYKIYNFSEPGDYTVKAQGNNMHGVSELKECVFVVQGISIPSEEPSASPSTIPSEEPSMSPSTTPSASPSTIPSEGPSVSPSTAPNVVKGDVNYDNQVTLADALLVLKVALRISSISDESVADVNDDNQVTLADALLVLKAALRIIDL